MSTGLHVSKATVNVTEWIKCYICDIQVVRYSNTIRREITWYKEFCFIRVVWTDWYKSVLCCCIVKVKWCLCCKYMVPITSFCKYKKYRVLKSNNFVKKKNVQGFGRQLNIPRRCPYNPENNSLVLQNFLLNCLWHYLNPSLIFICIFLWEEISCDTQPSVCSQP